MKKVLIIDDKAENLEIGKQEIEKFFPDFSVETCNNFRDAIGLLVFGHSYDVVLTDLNMPVCSTPAFNSNQRNTLWNKDEIVPYGIFIALRAVRVGVKRIAIITDNGHHASAANAALECIAGNASDFVALNYRDDVLWESKPNFLAGVHNLNMKNAKPDIEINGAKLLIADSFKHKGSITEGPNYGFQGALRFLLEN